MSFFEQQEKRINKQFISIFDSVYFVSEHGKGTVQQAFDFVVGTLLRKQTYLLLITPTSVKTVYVCSDNEQSQYEPFITFETIIYELKNCIDCNNVGIGTPIRKLGFGKKRFVEQLINLNMQLPEQVIFNTESPDITDADYTNEGDELAFYQGLPKEYDILRADNEKLKAQFQELWDKKQRPETFYEIQKNLYEGDRQRLTECNDKLDKSLLEVKSLNSHCNYLERSLEQSKRKAELDQHIAEKRISNLENQLAQAKADLADKPADEVELNPKTQTAVTRLLNVLFHKAQLDIAAHKGTTNKNIVNSSISFNAKITEKPVSHWIKQVQQLRIDTEKR
ncbi:hypothetical protein [Psychrobacter sp. MES7-P7E]|uniref:hypothetical protein n=1 Tax=Psychrobacter sp. MES7-P7E TaxID=2058322 RepID=UPI000C7ED178|nr:hypothetical protein [Psychrobacter sp. MES7-P7E]PLT22067.1 hypothetical protein CXF62_07000 [Psychrobacter sp. MES7-P7E]